MASELLAPAGSIDAGLAAFEAGADGVYLGLPRFSARSGAVNCSFEDIRRLKTAAENRSGALYLAVNTVVRQSEMGELIRSVGEALWCGVDAVIVQDLGVATVLRRCFPELELHASTQLGIHNVAGLREAARLGISRVVLSRECGLAQIRKFREACPQLELEVFIHGALCYSFSGLCLTSGVLLGRSGNRGECAQLCRNWYQSREGGKAYLLSCNDLALEDDVIALRDCGVRSFKIEGRMKGPEYVFHAVRLYRQLLDSAPGRTIAPKLREELFKNAALTFQRRKTRGFFKHPCGNQLIDRNFAGHRGIGLGAVERAGWTADGAVELQLRLAAPLARHDGVQWFPGGDSFAPVYSSVAQLEAGVAGGNTWKTVVRAENGELVRLKLFADTKVLPRAGDRVLQIMSTDLKTPRLNPNAVKPWKKTVPVRVRLASEAREFPTQSASLVFLVTLPSGKELCWERRVTLDRASVRRPFEEILGRTLETEGAAEFRFTGVQFVNATGLDGNGIFVPPSEMKSVRQESYAFFEEALRSERQDRAGLPSLQFTQARRAVPAISPETRGGFCVQLEAEGRGFPFLDETDLLALARQQKTDAEPGAANVAKIRVAEWNGLRMVPLSPVMTSDANAAAALEKLFADSDPRTRWCLGINNLSHLEMLRDLSARFGGRVAWWVDAYFYSANDWVLEGLSATLDSGVAEPVGFVPWVEDEAHRGSVPYLPLMISLGCLQRHSQEPSHCPAGCSGFAAYEFRNKDRVFSAVIRHCRTYLFSPNERSARSAKRGTPE